MNYENYLEENYSKATVKVYKREVKIYLQANPGAEKFLYADIINYIGKLRSRYANVRSILSIIAGLKSYYDFLSYSGKRKDNPGKSIRLRDKINRDIQLQDLFTNPELETLLEKKERYRVLEYRNKVLISLLTNQALKPGEIAALTTRDINLENATVYIKSTAKTNARELALKPNQIMLFYFYETGIRIKLLKNSKTDYFLISRNGRAMSGEEITKHVKKTYASFYANRKINCLTIRQSVIANLLKQGKDVRIVQVFAGHKYPSSTEKYKQTDVEELKMEINKYHPMK